MTEPRNDWQELRAAPDYRAFLKAYLGARGLSFSDFARAAGFGRGFPSDVISGRRRLTAKSLHSFESALKLPAPGRKLFRCLVAFEEGDLFPGLAPDFIARTIDELRRKPWDRTRREVRDRESPQAAAVLRDPCALSVYAAAGSPGHGASFEQLRARTRLSDREIEAATRELERAGLMKFADNLYEPSELHLFLRTQGHNDLVLGIFQEACRVASQRAVQGLNSDREMFFSSAFCIDETRLPELKTALRRTVLQFVDDSIQPEGDRVVRLLAGLHI